MLVGHFAVAFIAKRSEPRLSLGTLVLAVMIPDVLFFLFMLAGIEELQFKPGLGAANYLAGIDFPWSHSLLLNGLWGALFAGAYYLRRNYPRGALIIFLAVLSHWLLDFIAHPPDMPLAPGMSSRFGLGLWTSVPATIIVEGGLWLFAVIMYVRATRAKKRLGVFAFWPVILFLTLAWYGNIAGPPPTTGIAPVQSFIFFSLLVAWSYWMNRLRAAKASQ